MVELLQIIPLDFSPLALQPEDAPTRTVEEREGVEDGKRWMDGGEAQEESGSNIGRDLLSRP
jgi:hypothetical protein